MILYCLHDVKAETWSFPQTTNNVATAVREFEHLAKRPDFPVPDIELCKVADFDNLTGGIKVDFQIVLKGSDYAKS